MLILTTLFVVVEPKIGHDLVDSQRSKSGKDRVAGVLGGGGQDAAIKILFLDFEQVVKYRLNHPPLVVSEVVDQEESGLPRGIHHGKYLFPEQVVR